MNWANVTSLTIPEGVVQAVTCAGSVIWQAVKGFWHRGMSGKFSSVAYGDGVFLAKGKNGIYRSLDGKNWAFSTSIDTQPIYLGGMWFSTFFGGIMYSEDGLTWAQCSNIGSVYTSWDICAYGGGVWVANETGSGSGLRYSEDGKTWYQSNITSGRAYSVFYANGVFVTAISKAAGSSTDGMYYSEDGKTWTRARSTGDALGFFNGLWLGSDSEKNVLLYSEDGKEWTEGESLVLKNVYCNNGVFVGTSRGNGAYYSDDGKAWTQSNLTSGSYTGIFGNDLWLLYSDSVVYCSEDGKAWTECFRHDVSSEENTTGIITVRGYGNGLWLLTAQTEQTADGSYVYESYDYYSEDGKSWTKIKKKRGQAGATVYVDGLWVLADSAGLYWSDFKPEG